VRLGSASTSALLIRAGEARRRRYSVVKTGPGADAIIPLVQIKTARPPQSGDPCECGLRADATQPTCGELRDSLLARDFEQPVRYWRYHNLAIDAYCVQHAAYVKSPKSLAAHLCGLCIAFEHRGDATARQKLQRWLTTNPAIQKPQLPTFRGALTIADVWGIDDPIEYGKAVEAWARAAWDAYLELQPLARTWVAQSVG
jgi:hypothetical protein